MGAKNNKMKRKLNQKTDIIYKLDAYLSSKKKVVIKRKHSGSVFGYLSDIQNDCVLVDAVKSKKDASTFCFGKKSIVDIMAAS